MPGPMLGDIVVARETVGREAVDLGKSFEDHLTHLLVHGFLHLFGYDHMETGEAEKMESLETRILAMLGLSDPYAGQDPIIYLGTMNDFSTISAHEGNDGSDTSSAEEGSSPQRPEHSPRNQNSFWARALRLLRPAQGERLREDLAHALMPDINISNAFSPEDRAMLPSRSEARL